MLKNRIILAAAILGAGTFASFYGGAISYAILYLTILLPIVSLIYLAYVRRNFKIYQSASAQTANKGMRVPYQFILANEHLVAYTSVRVTFHTGMTYLEEVEPDREYCLLPSETVEKKTVICCLYRGVYPVGVSEIILTDLLGILRVKYAPPSTPHILVLPRVLHIERLAALPPDEDVKRSSFSLLTSHEQPDSDVRPYSDGDSLKLVHWKATARQQELLVRRTSETPKSEVLLLVDLSTVVGDQIHRAIVEDKVVECALAVSDHFLRSRIPAELLYAAVEPSILTMKNKLDFEKLYREYSTIQFTGDISVSALLDHEVHLLSGKEHCIIVTHKITDTLYQSCSRVLELGVGLCVIYIGDECGEEQLHGFDSRINVLHILKEQEITDVLEAGRGGRQ